MFSILAVLYGFRHAHQVVLARRWLTCGDAAHLMPHDHDSLSFNDFDGAIKPSVNGGCKLEFTLETPSILLLRIVN